MTASRRRLHQDLLNDYVDGALDDEARVRVGLLLTDSPDDRATVDAYREQADRLHSALDPVLDEPVPERLSAVLREDTDTAGDSPGDGAWAEAEDSTPPEAVAMPPRPRGGWRRGITLATASVALVLAGGWGGWQMHVRSQQMTTQDLAVESFLRNATNSYSLYGRADSPWTASPIGDIKSFVDSFKQAVGIEISQPSPADSKYQFVGAWPLPSHSGPAGQLVFKDPEGHRIAVYFQVTRPDDGTPLDPTVHRASSGDSGRLFTQRGDVSVLYWDTGRISYAVLGPMDRQVLSSVADGLFGGS